LTYGRQPARKLKNLGVGGIPRTLIQVGGAVLTCKKKVDETDNWGQSEGRWDGHRRRDRTLGENGTCPGGSVAKKNHDQIEKEGQTVGNG